MSGLVELVDKVKVGTIDALNQGRDRVLTAVDATGAALPAQMSTQVQELTTQHVAILDRLSHQYTCATQGSLAWRGLSLLRALASICASR